MSVASPPPPVDVHALARQLPLSDERYWFGDLTLAARPSAAVLNSSPHRLWQGREPWVRATVRAAAALIDDEKTLLTATGLATWELAAWAASEALGNVILLVPIPSGMIPEDAHLEMAKTLDDLGLSRNNALCMPWFVPARGSEKSLWKARDSLILQNADALLPVAIREGGFLASCLANDLVGGKADTEFSVAYPVGTTTAAQASEPLDPDQVRRALADVHWDYAVHWTRAAHGPWPGERKSDYYHAVVHGPQAGGHPRDARATLTRMITEQRVRATGRAMPMNVPMVSFSRLHPADMVPRMRWRKRYVRMEYEPWAIAVRWDAAQRMGVRDVTYGTLDDRKALAATDRLYFQRLSDTADWENEAEARLKGDLLLDALDPDDVLVLVPDPASAEALASSCPFPVRSLV